MKLIKLLSTLTCVILLGVMLSTSAMADPWNRKTTVTFSGPVEIPGVHLKGWATLPAGTYIFKVLDVQRDRNIVQIFNQDESVCYATILAIPNYRLNATDKTVITFRERPAGEPEAIRAWFYPGEHFGSEFVYPKKRAMELAKANNTPVIFSPTDENLETVEPIQPPAAPQVTQMNAEPLKAYNAAGDEMELSQAVTPPPPPNMQTTPATPAPVASSDFANTAATPGNSLPQTGSPVPLLFLSGIFALGCAIAIRFVRA